MAVCDVHFHRPSWAERHGAALLTVIAACGIGVLAVVLRFWHLGARTFHDDESLYSLIARETARGGGYEHIAGLHGPLHILGAAGVFAAFGDSDFTARALSAAAGVALALLPFVFVRHLGRPAAIIAALLLAVSPTMLYYSRFAGPDVLLALFTLASALLLWRYLVAPERPLLYLLAATCALAVATSEMWLAIVPIFSIYLAYRVGVSFAEQSRTAPATSDAPTWYSVLGLKTDAPARDIRRAYRLRVDRTESRTERATLADAYNALMSPSKRQAYDRRLHRAALATESDAPGAASPGRVAAMSFGFGWLIALAWPFAGAARAGLNLRERPVAADPFALLTLLMLPFYGPLVQKLSFVGDRGFVGQRQIVVIGGEDITPGGEMPVMLATLGLLFALAMVLGMAWKWHVWVVAWAIFYGITITLFTGFFSHSDGTWTGIWGTLDATWRPDARHADGPIYYHGMMLAVYEFVPLGIIAVSTAVYALRCGMRDRAIIAVTAVGLAALTVLPASAPVIGGVRPFVALVTVVVGVLALRIPELTKFLAVWCAGAFGVFSLIGLKEPWLTVHVALPAIMLAARISGDAISTLEPVRMPSMQFPAYAPRRLAQGAMGAGVAVGAIFALQSGVLASWGHGEVPQLTNALARHDRGDTPVELLAPSQSAPDVRELRDAIARVAAVSGDGEALVVAVDTSGGFTDGLGWYLREYDNLAFADMRTPYDAPAGAVVLVDSRNRWNVRTAEPSAMVTFTRRWRFPGDYDGLSSNDVVSKLVSADAWRSWSAYWRDRPSIGALEYDEGVALFPSELSAAILLPRQSDVLSTSTQPAPAP